MDIVHGAMRFQEFRELSSLLSKVLSGHSQPSGGAVSQVKRCVGTQDGLKNQDAHKGPGSGPEDSIPLAWLGLVFAGSELKRVLEAPPMDDILSLTEAAHYLNVESTFLWRAAETGELKAERVKLEEREVWRFQKSDLDSWRQPAANSVPTEVHLATLELVQQNQTTIEQLQRRMLQVQLAAAQGQRLLAESNDASLQERARLLELKQKLASTESELKVWKERASMPWWRRLWSSKRNSHVS